MTPEEAHAELVACIAGTSPDVIMTNPDIVDRIVAAWRTLDEALRGGADLPDEWDRMTATPAAKRGGKANGSTWMDLSGKGYVPPPDGVDSAGRSFWMAATVDDFREGRWKPTPRVRDDRYPPPVAGPGSGREAWATWAAARGVEVPRRMNRDRIREECRRKGLLNDNPNP